MGDTFRSDNLSPVRGPVPSWTADPLTVALAEAEALLPDHWTLKLTSSQHYWAAASYGYSLAHYRANVGRARFCPYYSAFGTTAVEALTGLAAELRKDERPWEVW